MMVASGWPASADVPYDEPGATAPGSGPGSGSGPEDWIWPLESFRLESPFVAPAHRYGPGHRGVDLRALHTRQVRAPADGTVVFVGEVAGRGILTIDHGGGLVSTLEPVDADLIAGATIAQGDTAGTIMLGGHTASGAVHFGLRLDGEYVNPLLLLGTVPRAVLLPCC